MGSYVFTSHDGFGLGHVRRNVSLAEAVLRRDPYADINIVTGVTADVPWLRRRDMRIVRVPSLVKDAEGQYTNPLMAAADAADRRAAIFRRVIDTVCPDVVVVDRHPFGTFGELQPGLERCRRLGVATVLGLRDIIDDAPVVQAELAGPRWEGAAQQFDHAVVYGARHVCDHEAEYGLTIRPEYVGWVNRQPMQPRRQPPVDDRLLVIAAGGGADGANARSLGSELVRRNADWRGVMVLGPFADASVAPAQPRLDVHGAVDGCGELFARAAASIQMAGYNSTVEALAAGLRPLLVPRRAPRREQAIRATRLAMLGLADVVDEGTQADELSWMLQRPRRLGATALADAGVHLDGAERTASLLTELAGRNVRTLTALGAGR